MTEQDKVLFTSMLENLEGTKDLLSELSFYNALTRDLSNKTILMINEMQKLFNKTM